MQLEARISGIPCRVEPTRVLVVPGTRSYHAASDVDYYGYEEVEFTVLDRRGRPAPWLERKMTEDERQIIERRILRAQR